MGCDYSSTQSIERAASNILILATTQSFFDFTVYLCGCGIQKVHYRGGKSDFEKLKRKIAQMRQDYPMHPDYVEYLEKIEWIVGEMVNSMEGKVNKEFWNKIFDEKKGEGYEGSGMRVENLKITGWFKYLFGT